MVAREPVSLIAMNADGVGLKVQLAWRHDRHAHTISVLIDDRLIPVLESIEGSSTDTFPPSPPLQQLSVEALRPATQVALLVGMAGKCHWSISIEPIDHRAAFVFDVACRAGASVEQLGSQYSLLAAGLTTQDDHEATLAVAGRSIQIRCDRVGPTAATIQNSPSGIRIEPATVKTSGTTRWRYTIELE